MNYTDYFMVVSGLLMLIISFYLDNFVYEFFKYKQNEEMKSRGRNFFLIFSSVWVIAPAFAILSFTVFASQHNMYVGEARLALLWSGLAGILVLTYIVKMLVARSRPLAKQYIPFTHIYDYSFPSSHSAFAFGVLALLHSEMETTQAIWFIFAVLVAMSRIYLERHYLSDVVAGGILGYFAGSLIIRANNISTIIIATTIAFFAMLFLGKMFKLKESSLESQSKNLKTKRHLKQKLSKQKGKKKLKRR